MQNISLQHSKIHHIVNCNSSDFSRTKLNEKEQYKKLVEQMQNGGFHSNGGGTSFANPKIPKIQPIKMNGVSHDT